MTRHQKYYAENREKEKARSRANTQKQVAANRERREANKKVRMQQMDEKKSRAEYYREYRQRNLEKKKEQLKKYASKQQGKKPAQRVYKLRQVDYSQMMLVQIDRKTAIYAPKGSDPETVRQQYLTKNKKAA